MEQLQKIKNLLRIALVCILVLTNSSCRTDLVYGIRGNAKVDITKYSAYQDKNLQKFNIQKHQKIKKSKHNKLYREFMRPYKNNGRTTKQRLLRYQDQ